MIGTPDGDAPGPRRPEAAPRVDPESARSWTCMDMCDAGESMHIQRVVAAWWVCQQQGPKEHPFPSLMMPEHPGPDYPTKPDLQLRG